MNFRSHIAADGLPRRLFTVADVERMVEVGLIGEDERVELIDGELIPMSPKGNEHEIYKTALMMYWARRCPPDLVFVPETTFRLSVDTFLEPDFVVMPRTVGIRKLNGATALLAVEIGVSSLGYDLGKKAGVYARFGIRELWVIDPIARVVHVHRRPSPEGYGEVQAFGDSDMLSPELAPDLAFRLADLDLTD
ncbi:Uma2 family endonuclease [Chthonobacter albigriseus]|uniref:Uma2 family endonuclease n=1 Tax=Chthonobacter albigriseus TaxID=1683161 RepID=UPI0015EE665F|nr:Uma2 family endonuclease [Chthonobacter albigriseus]